MAVAVHAVLFALAIGSVKIIGPPHEPRAVDLQLIQLQPPPLRQLHPQSLKTVRASAPAPPAPAPVVPAPPAPAVTAPAAAAIPAQSSPSADAAGRVRAMLRSSAGCDEAAFLKLTRAEQEKCARWRAAQADPNLQVPLPIDPKVKAWDDASLQYRKNGRYMPIGPPGRGVMKVPGLPPGHTLVRVGPLSIGLPPGAFNDDDAPPP